MFVCCLDGVLRASRGAEVAPRILLERLGHAPRFPTSPWSGVDGERSLTMARADFRSVAVNRCG
jgi:hypothetical protein